MNQTVKVVKEYYNSGYQRMPFDTDVLTTCVDNLSQDEMDYIMERRNVTIRTADAQFKFFMQKLLSRYHDITARRTRIDSDGCIEFTTKSSVIELCDNAADFEACKKCHISRICDLDDDRTAQLPMASVGNIMAALLVFPVTE